jgi:hypothetical protein
MDAGGGGDIGQAEGETGRIGGPEFAREEGGGGDARNALQERAAVSSARESGSSLRDLVISLGFASTEALG